MSCSCYSCQILIKLITPLKIFQQSTSTKFNENSSSSSRVCYCRPTDTTKPKVASCNVASGKGIMAPYKIIAFYCKNGTMHKNTLCGTNGTMHKNTLCGTNGTMHMNTLCGTNGTMHVNTPCGTNENILITNEHTW